MKFKPFTMAQISAKWPSGSLLSLHSSNPEPFTWNELNELIGSDLEANIKQSSLAYASTQGSLKLRAILAQQYHDSNINADDIVLTAGAQEGIFLLMNALLNKGDEVICFSPCFEPLSLVAEQCGAQVALLPLNEANQWQVNWQQLEQTINTKTQLMVINFPHNPTGTHITAADQDRLIGLCEKYDCWLFSDEVFRGLEHDPEDRIPAAADKYHKAISMGVMSKSLALPGIRLGWLALQDIELLHAIMTVKSHLSICQSSIDTQLCESIIPHSKLIWQRNISIINHNKKWLEQQLSNHPELYWQTPKAAATGFIQLKRKQATALTAQWAQDHQILVMPETAFLTAHAGFRLTLGKHNAESLYQLILTDNLH